MNTKKQLLLQKINRQATCFPKDKKLNNLHIVGSGLEFLVCRAESHKWGSVAIRTPWERNIFNDNDVYVDARCIMRQEKIIGDHLYKLGIPQPLFYEFSFNEEIDFMISQYIENDTNAVNMFDFGRLMRKIHDQPHPPIDPVTLGEHKINHALAKRIVKRLQVVIKYTNIEIEDLRIETILNVLDNYKPQNISLLHMDARPANLLTKSGNIKAIIDWSNALIGDTNLELIAIDEYGLMNSDFLDGYQPTNSFLRMPEEVELIYRLDTAIMLAAVFLFEAPDPIKAKKQIKHVLKFYNQIKNTICC